MANGIGHNFVLLRRLLLVAGGLTAFSGCARWTPKDTGQQVIVLGFDGVDPGLLKKWMDEGHLPNVSDLVREGTFQTLGTTLPPESPVAWASFATGTNPGKHGIFDFLRRDTQTYFPEIGLTSREKPKFLFGLVPLGKPKITNHRQGPPFWQYLAERGIRTTVLRAPLSFPPEEVPGGKLLGGLGIPDLRQTWGTFFYFATDLSKWEIGNTEFGGKLVRLNLENDVARTEIEGPADPTKEKFQRLAIPLELQLGSNKDRVTLQLQGQEETVGERRWSRWFTVEYRINPLLKVKGICRFYILETYPELRVYMTPLNLHPAEPPVPVSYPEEFSGELARELGLFKTLGWAHDTWAINEERIPEDVFLEDLFETMDRHAQITLRELKNRPNLFVSVFYGTDSASHIFFRLLDPEHPRYDPDLAAQYGDAVLRTYRKMDEIVGKVRREAGPDATLLIVSDHGFHTWRKEFNTNTWLVHNGFMALKGMEEEGKKTLDDLFSQGSFFPNVDWSRTKAYALGLGQIYINLRGREKQGAVSPGEEYERLCTEIAEKLKAFRDPDNDQPVVQGVYRKQEGYHGDQMDAAPDLVVSFRDGYRTSWQTCLGAIPNGIVVANMKKWSGDHCSSDPSDTGGVLLSNRRIQRDGHNIIDIAPTVIQLFQEPVPARLDGKPIQFSQ